MANGTWKIARGRNGSQWSLAVFAVLALIVLLLGRAQPALFSRARAHLSDWSAPALEVARTPVTLASQWVSGIGNLFWTYQENVRLKTENARLRQWQNAALVLQQRLTRYQLLLNAVPDPALASVTARVIGRDSRPFLDTLILDAGRRQGVKPGEAVVDEQGMIGRIFVAGDHTAWVILLTDLNSRIPVAIEPGNMKAVLTGDNSASPTLEVSAQGTKLKQGEPIITSGDGGLLPAGLPIGMVWWDGQAFRAALLADSANSNDVRILDLKNPPEQLPELSAKDLPVAAAGLPPLAPPPPKPASTPAPQPQQAATVPPPQAARRSTETSEPTQAAGEPRTAAPLPAISPPPEQAGTAVQAAGPPASEPGQAPPEVPSAVSPQPAPSAVPAAPNTASNTQDNSQDNSTDEQDQ
jgi:rod shape-determining protein MreC